LGQGLGPDSGTMEYVQKKRESTSPRVAKARLIRVALSSFSGKGFTALIWRVRENERRRTRVRSFGARRAEGDGCRATGAGRRAQGEVRSAKCDGQMRRREQMRCERRCRRRCRQRRSCTRCTHPHPNPFNAPRRGVRPLRSTLTEGRIPHSSSHSSEPAF